MKKEHPISRAGDQLGFSWGIKGQALGDSLQNPSYVESGQKAALEPL